MSLSEELALAALPDTSPELLEELSRREQPELASCLAQNPSVPLSALCRLWHQHPQQAFANPIIPLLLLEDPNFFFHGENRSLLQALLKAKDIPESFIALVARSSDDWLLHLLA